MSVVSLICLALAGAGILVLAWPKLRGLVPVLQASQHSDPVECYRALAAALKAMDKPDVVEQLKATVWGHLE